MEDRFPDMMTEAGHGGFLSSASYNAFLEDAIRSVDDSAARAHTVNKVEQWRQQYWIHRLVERAVELLAAETLRPHMLYLRSDVDLELLSILKQQHSCDTRLFRGFLVADELWSRCTSDGFLPSAAYQASAWRDNEGVTVLTFSEDRPFREGGVDRGNDYLERFIDLRRFATVHEVLKSRRDTIDVLYPLYREIHTVAIMANCVRQKDRRLRGISLSPAPLLNAGFDVPLVEPFFYLWPLLFRIVDAALVHLNVGWGIQALALAAFLPNPERTVIDFYEVLSFLPDAFFERTHSSAEEVRHAEAYLFRTHDHIMHLCSDETSVRLAEKYGRGKSIVSVTEYLQKPLYDSPPRTDGEIRLVYGGAMLAKNSPDNFYYRPFLSAVRHYTRDNLRLYIYNSPFLDGTGENNGLKEVIREHGLDSAYACRPLKLDDFTRQITEYDYGIFLLTARDLNAPESYNYFMATKFLTYLQAGLPIVIDGGYRYMADLVERYSIGVVLYGSDAERLPEILNKVDLPALKRNVIKFREEFSIEKGGEKVLDMYHDILRSLENCPPCNVSDVKASPAGPLPPERADFEEMIDVMARKENRLYYRDQSARTMVSLADLAQQFDPSVIVELGTLGGLSLRTWVASTRQTRIYAVDLSFQTLRETLEFLPADLSRVTLLEQDILKTDFPSLWTPQDRVIFFIDAHDLPNVPIMTHVLTTALPSLPDGSVVVIDDLWFSEERLTPDNAGAFLEGRVLNEIDELQCFHGHFAPYHAGGSFMGFAEVIPLLKFVNEHGIPLIHDRGGKHASFVWKKTYLEQCQRAIEGPDDSVVEVYGSVQYNPLESVPVYGPHSETMRRIVALYRQRNLREAAETLSKALSQDPCNEGLSYGLAVCLARGGMLSQARDVLARNLGASSHPRYRRLSDDLARRTGGAEPQPTGTRQQPSEACGITLFAMPKAFTGHTATIQKNAIRSWARLDPAPEIILFGNELGIREMAQEVGAKHIADIGRNEFGTPLVDKLFEAAQNRASNAVLAYVNADMILMQSFMGGMQTVQSSLADFLLIGQRWDLVVLHEIDFSVSQWQESLLRQVQDHAMLHAECGLDYFVFRRGLWPQIPPFAIGRTAWDNWLVMDPRRRAVPVVDGTEFITTVHQDHDYGHVRGGRQEAWNGEEARRNLSLAGAVDDSAYTTGASWILDKDGHLVKAHARQPGFSAPAYRGRRVAWLARQAEELMARREMELAACKWEEALTLLDRLRRSIRQQTGPASFPKDHPITKSYQTACTALARCYAELGRPDQAATCYTRLLETTGIEIQGDPHPDAQERGQGRRIALIVSIPERSENLRSVIRDIEHQVDEIRILLNEFDAAPKDLYAFKKVSVVQTSREGELFASGVWNLLEPQDEGYVFVLDDDIVYPADYVQRMIAKIEEHRRRAVVVVHGIDFCEPFVDCTRDRTVCRFQVARSRDGVVDAGGVGTLAFHTSTLRPQVGDFANPNFRDLWFAVLAARHAVPIICIARGAHWLRARATEGKQLWYRFSDQKWKDVKNRVFREHLLPLLDVEPRPGRARRRDFSIFCITNGRSTFEYSVRSLMESHDLQERTRVLSGMHFRDAMAKCIEICDTPYFFKVDDDFILHPDAIAYMRERVLEYPRPEELGIYYCHLWEDWTSRVRESFKVYNAEALRKIGGFKADPHGKVDRTTMARLEQAGYKVVGDPGVVAIHACGAWLELLEYERLWSSMAQEPYRKPTHEAMKKYCGTKSLDEQYDMRLGLLERVNEQLNTPFHRFLAEGKTRHPATPQVAEPAPDRPSGAELPADSETKTAQDHCPEIDSVVAGSSPAIDAVPVPTACGITLFAMPKALMGHTATIQKNAIRSWARLDPAPEIILFGDEPGIREMAEEVGAKHIAPISRNEFGTPLVDKLFEAAQDHASNAVLAYVNADVILLQDFMQAVQRVHPRLAEFLLIGQRWDLCVLDEIGFDEPGWRERLARQLQEHAMLHAECGLDYFVFRKGLWPQIPPFAIGRTAWDNWLVMDPHKRGVPVVDGTEYITAVHQEHDYNHVAGGRHEAWNGAEAERNRTLAGRTNQTGLTSGATWLLRKDGELVETGRRQPQYITAAYREQRSTWLLREARRLLAVGARELAASKCEETIGWLDTWLQLRRLGVASSESARPVDIGALYIAGYTLLAQCCMQMGCRERVVAAYAQLLEHPVVRIPPAQRNAIVQVRDRLVRQWETRGQREDAPADRACGDVGPRVNPPRSPKPPAVCPSPDPVEGGLAVGYRPKVTVITSCHNGEPYLEECVESILAQTMTEWELLLIDDGSTDDTPRMIEEYARRDARIRHFRFPDNRGPYVRRNFGISRAASGFIVIHDADDIMSPAKLERLYGEINKDNCLAMVGSFPRTFLEEFRGLEHTESGSLPLDSDAILASCAAWQATISHGTAIIRKTLFDAIGLYDENSFAADAFWSAKLALYVETGAAMRTANLPEYLTLIRIHPGSQTQTLPVFDPRNRRVRYRYYCECRLRRIREKWRRQPRLDVAAELRDCSCSDFLTRFKSKILQWESETLPVHFMNDLLTGAAAAFQSRLYVSCVTILNGLEVMQRDIARRVMGFDLFRAMALYASGLPDRGRTYVQREIENHDSSIARRFLRDSGEAGASMAIHRWYEENASHLELHLGDGDRVRIAMTKV